MKKNLVFPGLTFLFAAVLLTFTGCPQSSSVAPQPGDSPKGKPGVTSNEGVVEPLVPTAPSQTPADAKPAAEEKKEGARFVPAQPLGKVAAEVVPLPPVADLVAQVDSYVEKLGKSIEDLDGTPKYKEDNEPIVRDSSALVVVALAIGKTEADSKYKKAAPGMIKAATELAAAGTFDDAKKKYAALQASLTSESDPASLEWTKVAELKPLKKAVSNLDSLIKRQSGTETKLKKKPEPVIEALAALSVILHSSIANIKDTTKPDAADQWKKECELSRDAAIKANAAAHGFAEGKADFKEYQSAYNDLKKTCDSCHEVFHHETAEK